ncbi:MAG: hypothetical protein OHK0012_25550 [Synechococcales cyanobacterium]
MWRSGGLTKPDKERSGHGVDGLNCHGFQDGFPRLGGVHKEPFPAVDSGEGYSINNLLTNDLLAHGSTPPMAGH